LFSFLSWFWPPSSSSSFSPSSATMADPLSLLQKYFSEKRTHEILETSDGQIVFGDLAWPKETKTNYRKPRREGEDTDY